MVIPIIHLLWFPRHPRGEKEGEDAEDDPQPWGACILM
jgi:hypothetical protein